MRALADTSILIATVKPDEKEPDLLRFNEGVAVSALSWTEMTVGLHTTKSLQVYKKRLSQIATLRELFPITLPFDDSCVSAHEAIMARITEYGSEPRANTTDRLIAATAVAHSLTLVTRNMADLKGLEGLVEVVEG